MGAHDLRVSDRASLVAAMWCRGLHRQINAHVVVSACADAFTDSPVTVDGVAIEVQQRDQTPEPMRHRRAHMNMGRTWAPRRAICDSRSRLRRSAGTPWRLLPR